MSTTNIEGNNNELGNC